MVVVVVIVAIAIATPAVSILTECMVAVVVATVEVASLSHYSRFIDSHIRCSLLLPSHGVTT